MSSIDQCQHKHISFIECPTDHELALSCSSKQLAIYQLEQDIPSSEKSFDGKPGDILVGGGSGEAESLRISIPKAVLFFKSEEVPSFESYDEIYKHFWSPSFAYRIGQGFKKVGWEPDTPLETWLTERVLNLLIDDNLIHFADLKIEAERDAAGNAAPRHT